FRTISRLSLRFALGVLVLSARSSEASQEDVQLTPGQRRVIDFARTVSVGASKAAEDELRSSFDSTYFRLRLASQGSGRGHVLASLSADELLSRVRGALAVVEFTNNFGLDAESLKLHPGLAAMDLVTVEAYGNRLPSMWDLKSVGSPLAANVSANQWGVQDAAETGLYLLPDFASPGHPTAQEMAERPTYLAGNLRRLDLGVQRYGAMAAIVRGDVVKQRAVILGSDSGGWESGCNMSVSPVVKPDSMEKAAFVCDAVPSTPLGVVENQLHSLLANSRTFSRVGGDLPRVVWQLLGEKADVRPLEGNMYTEAALMGPLRMVDVKVLVGSFPGLFGTALGKLLRSFCVKHQIPLAWGFGAGRTWPDEEARTFVFLPLEPEEFWTAGHERLLDPLAGWSSTNASGFGGNSSSEASWDKVWADVVSARAGQQGSLRSSSSSGPDKDHFSAWWATLSGSGPPVQPLGGGDCASSDLCFGTFDSGSRSKECVCRTLPPPEPNSGIVEFSV
ncbi:unnamed protein product, partial [Polarella glacialis]